MSWFEVDREGLAKLMEGRRGKEWILYELLQNAWDENSKNVTVVLSREPGSRYVDLVVTDDNPEGFKDLSHAFVLFAESRKKGDATKRGRYNLGEKLVLALAESASIASTKGTVTFDQEGRRQSRKCRLIGSAFSGRFKLTNDEAELMRRSAFTMIAPASIVTTINGEALPQRDVLREFTATLPTEVGDAEGVIRRTTRQTMVRIYQPLEGELPFIYEMGIPIVGHADRWHIDIQQKVPLSLERDNVTPAYLARLRALVLENMIDQVDAEDANAWARDAIRHHGGDLSAGALQRVAELRFGERRVAYDPSDPEANHLAMSRGYQVVYGGNMKSEEWEAMRRVGAILPAGQVTPSPKPFSADGDPLKLVEMKEWTPDMRAAAAYAERVHEHLFGARVLVAFTIDTDWRFHAAYGNSRLIVNVSRCGQRFLGNLTLFNELLIHEFAHRAVSNHLSEGFHKECCRLGALLSQIALDHPNVFRMDAA
jgi:hypothetical protein